MIRCIMFGVDTICDLVISACNPNDVEIVCLLDDDPRKIGRYYRGLPIVDPDSVNSYPFDFIIITCAPYCKVYRRLIELGVEPGSILNPFYMNEASNLSDIYLTRKNQEAIITGISYTMFGLNLNKLNINAVNLSMESQDLFFDYLMAKNYILKYPGAPDIKYAIIGLAYYSFEYEMLSSNLALYSLKYSFLEEMVREECTESWIKMCNIRRQLSDERLSRNIYEKIFKGKFVSSVPDDVAMNRINGLRNLDDISLKKARQELAKKHSAKDYPETVENNQFILNKYLSMLDNFNIKPVILIHPQHPDYRECFSDRLRMTLDNSIQQQKSKHSFIFLNLFDSTLFNSDDYFDIDHLNIRGANKVTDILNSVLV